MSETSSTNTNTSSIHRFGNSDSSIPSSTSTIAGLGATTGKAIKQIGMVVKHGIEAVIILRRLDDIEAILLAKPAGPSVDPGILKDYLLEPSRYVGIKI